MTTRKPQQDKEAGAVLCAGLFFLVTGDEAAAHIVPPEQVSLYYKGAAMACDCRDVDARMEEVIRSTFRVKGCRLVIAATDKGKLEELMDTYEGPAKDTVRVLAASWLAGLPFTRLDHDDKGAPDRLPESPTPPPTPAGTLDPEAHSAPQVTPKDSLTLDGLRQLLAVPS